MHPVQIGTQRQRLAKLLHRGLSVSRRCSRFAQYLVSPRRVRVPFGQNIERLLGEARMRLAQVVQQIGIAGLLLQSFLQLVDRLARPARFE